MTTGERATVLIVDDESDVADAYAAQLRGEYAVRIANSGEAGLNALGPAVDVVLLDRRMPDISGEEVLAEIRDRGLDTRVAMVTAVDPDFDIIDMPFDDYVVKPASRAELIETVERLLSCASYQETIREYYAVSSKVATLKATKSDAELQASEQFQELESRLDHLSESLEKLVTEFDREDYIAVFRDIETPARPIDGP